MSEPTTATIDAPAQGEKPTSEFMADIAGDFEAMDTGKEVEARPPSSKTTPEKPPAQTDKIEKPSDRNEKGQFVKPADKPKPEKPEKPEVKPEAKTETAETKPPGKMRELGERYDTLKKEVEHTYKPTISKLEARIKELESGTKTEDPEPLKSRIQQLEQQNSELEKRMEYVDYTASSDFRNKFVQPYNDEYQKSMNTFSQLRVREPDGVDETTGEPRFKRRPATEQDLLQLAALDYADMDEKANAMFGASAPRVIAHIEKLQELATAKSRAEKSGLDRAVELKKQREAQSAGRSKLLKDTWDDINRGMREKFPKAFEVAEGDSEDKGAHTKGFALADLLFVGRNALTPEQVESLPPSFRDIVKGGQELPDAKRLELHAIARLKMANHDRMMVRLKKATARIGELEKELADYQKSEPEAGHAGAKETPENPLDWESQVAKDMAAMDKR